MTRILIVSHYFAPEIGAPQTRLGELARIWAGSGDDVTVLTGFPNHPTGVIPQEYRGKLQMREERDGYRVVRTWVYATPNERVIRKTLGHLSFMITSVVLGFFAVGRPYVVVCSSPTFFSIFSSWLTARLKRAKFVLEIRDLWPAAIVEVGVLRDKRLIAILEAVELWCYRRADLVIPVTRGLRDDIVSRGIPATKVQIITNGVDVSRFERASGFDEARTELGAATTDLLVLYAGTHGMLYDLQLVANSAAEMTNDPVHFAFVGSGVGKTHLAEHVERLGLHNVTMLPAVAADEVPALMGAADVCVLPFKDIPMVEMVLAAKMFEYLAAGRPVVALMFGESVEVLEGAGAIVLRPGDQDGFVAILHELAADPVRRERMGVAARNYVREHFDRNVLARNYRALIDRLIAER